MKMHSKRIFSLFMSFVLICVSFCVSPTLFAFGGELDCQGKIDLVIHNWCDTNITENMSDFEKIKAVYDFVVKNTDYDVPVSKITNDVDVDLGERSAHRAYAALFGQAGYVSAQSMKVYDTYLDSKIKTAELSFGTNVTVNSYVKTIDGKEYYKISIKDNSGISSGYVLMSDITIDNSLQYDPYETFDLKNEISQGFAVCEGYSELVKDIFDYIGIDSKLVTTHYNDGTLQKGHKWNVVMLDGKYYNFDTTYGASTSVKIMKDFDYAYFLRGYSSDVMSDDAHSYQTILDSCKTVEEIDVASQISPTDYSLNFNGNSDGYFVYSYQKISDDIVNATKNLVYNGQDYKEKLKLVIPGYVYGKDFKAYFNDNYVNAGTKKVTIEYKDLSGTTKTKDLEFSIAAHDLSTTDIDKSGTTQAVYFSGKRVSPTVTFISALNLAENKDYTVSYYRDEACATVTDNLTSPGKVYVLVKGIDNCKGLIKLSFDIVKADLSNIDLQWNNSYAPTYTVQSFNLGDQELKNGVDYTINGITYPNGNNVGAVAQISISALPSSKYIVGSGTIKLNINGSLDLSALNNSAFVTNYYTYSGNAIAPKPNLNVKIGGNSVTLQYGKDYIVNSYVNNTNAGKAVANVSFIGNYKGSASMYFNIAKADITKLSATLGNCYYTGKSHYPSVTVKQGSRTLKNGTDYSLSGAATKCGAYKLTIKGINNFNGSFQRIYVVRPKKVTGLKKSSNSTSKITLAWSSLSSTTSSRYPIYYNVYAYDASKKAWRIIVSNTKSTSYTVSALYSNGKKVNLSAGRVYKFKVIAYIYYGKSKYYGTYSDVLNAETRPKVSNVTIYTPATSGSAVTAKWKRASSSGYLVYISPYSNFSKSVSSKLITSYATTSYRFTKLRRGKYYYVKVKAFKTVNGKRYYGSWSYVKKIKCR